MRKGIILILMIIMIVTGCSSNIEDKTVLELDEAYKTGNYETVIQEAKSYLEEDPESYLVWNQLGWAYWKIDDIEEAEKCFDQCIELNPEWDNAYVGKGAIYRKLEDYEKARESYLKAIELLPENAEAFSSLVVIEIGEENYQAAVEYGEKAWALRKDFPSIAANLSLAYHYNDDFEKRDELFREAERLEYSSIGILKSLFYEE